MSLLTKSIWAEKIQRRIEGGDISIPKVDKRDIYLAMEPARNQLIQKYLNINPNDIPSEFVTTYENVMVLKDAARERFYSTLPAQLISVSIKGKFSNTIGLRQISGMKDEYDVFIPMNSGDAGVFSGLEASGLGGKVGYWLEGSKVVYENMPYYFENKGVLIKMVSSVYSLGDDDYFPLPAGLENDFEDIVYARMTGMQQTPQKKVTDGNPNTD